MVVIIRVNSEVLTSKLSKLLFFLYYRGSPSSFARSQLPRRFRMSTFVGRIRLSRSVLIAQTGHGMRPFQKIEIRN